MLETEQETDGRWIAEITDLPGVMAYGSTREEAVAAVEVLAVRVKSREWKHFLILFAAQCLSYALLCWNYRAVAKGMIPQVVGSDLIFAAVNFKLLKRVASADSNLAWAGYVLGGAAGSAISVYLTKVIWGS